MCVVGKSANYSANWERLIRTSKQIYTASHGERSAWGKVAVVAVAVVVGGRGRWVGVVFYRSYALGCKDLLPECLCRHRIRTLA